MAAALSTSPQRQHRVDAVGAEHAALADRDEVLVARAAERAARRRGEVGVADAGHGVEQDVVADVDALVADGHGGAGNDALHLVLRLVAERAVHRYLFGSM